MCSKMHAQLINETLEGDFFVLTLAGIRQHLDVDVRTLGHLRVRAQLVPDEVE